MKITAITRPHKSLIMLEWTEDEFLEALGMPPEELIDLLEGLPLPLVLYEFVDGIIQDVQHTLDNEDIPESGELTPKGVLEFLGCWQAV